MIRTYKRKNPAKYFEICFVVALFLASLYFFLFPIEKSHYWDECVYLQHAEIFTAGRTNYSELYYRPPFLSLWISLGYLAWHNMYMAQLMVALLNSAGVVAIYFLAKRLVNWQVGVIGALSFILSNTVLTEGHFILTDAPSHSLLVISLLLFYIAIDSNNSKQQNALFFFSGLIFALGILTKYTLLFFSIYFLMIYLIKRVKVPRKQLFNFGLGAGIPMAIYFVMSQIYFGFFLAPFITAKNIIDVSPPEPAMFYVSHFMEFFSLFVVIGLALAVIFLSIESKKQKDVLLLLAISVIFFIYMSATAHKEVRYLFPISFCIYILSAYGYVSLIQRIKIFQSRYLNKMAQSIFFLIVLVVLISTNAGLISGQIKGGIKNNATTEAITVAEYLKSTISENDTVYTLLNYPILAYYSGHYAKWLLPKNTTLECTRESFDAYLIADNSYLVVFPSLKTFENIYVNYSSLENCSLVKLIDDKHGGIIYKTIFS